MEYETLHTAKKGNEMNNATETTTATINWKNLIVSDGDAETGTELGRLVEVDDSSLLHVTLDDKGAIKSWPQLFVSAPGEDPNENTPNVPVDWTGFAEAVNETREFLGASLEDAQK